MEISYIQIIYFFIIHFKYVFVNFFININTLLASPLLAISMFTSINSLCVISLNMKVLNVTAFFLQLETIGTRTFCT